MCESVPPSFPVPSLPTSDTVKINLVSVKDGWSIEFNYVEKRIVVKDVD
jgi:hypothetical protein